MNWNHKKALVTGGCGHIGSFVVRKLIERKAHRIIILDNMSAYPFDQLTVFCRDIRDLDNIEIIKGDICDEKLVCEVMKDIDLVFHLAAYADVAATIQNPDEDFRTNVIGTYNVLKASLDNGVEKFIFASSAAIYGDKPWKNNEPPRFREGMKPNPLSTYANSKLWGENEALLFYKLYGLKTVSLRYFSVYGPMQIPKPKSHSWVVAIFLMKALKGKPLTVYGGNQVRDFTYVEDIAEATVRAAEVNGIEGEVINVGTGRPTKIIDLAYMISSLFRDEFGIKVNINMLNYRPKGDPLGGYADVTKAKTLLGLTSQISLEEGLEKTLEWYIEHEQLIPEWL